MASSNPKRFLIIASVFPPDIIGGAEISAANFALWLHQQGHEVHVLTTAKSSHDVCDAQERDGLKIWRVWMPRAYPAFHADKAPWWKKPLWHLQDHCDPRNRTIVRRVLDLARPDFINCHILQGLGYNILREISLRNIPTTYFLHDLSLACFRMAMFKNGKNCQHQCLPCKLSATYKLSLIKTIPKIEFISPSQANIDTLKKYLPMHRWRHAKILNANKYPEPTVDRLATPYTRLLFVGRIHSSKGINMLLKVAERLATKHRFTLTVIGTGHEYTTLLKQYGHYSWCDFTGFISQPMISNYMHNSDLLCIPSIWAENSPGVVVHALTLGLPVIGSNQGGIPELIQHDRNGSLVTAGDEIAWYTALDDVLSSPHKINRWSQYARLHAQDFDQDTLGKKLYNHIVSPPT